MSETSLSYYVNALRYSRKIISFFFNEKRSVQSLSTHC